MRGFVFSIDMALAATGVVLLFLILVQSVNSPMDSRALGPLLAQDATMGWIFSSPSSSSPPLPSSDEYYCDTGFRPRVTVELLDPLDPTDWVSQSNCGGVP